MVKKVPTDKHCVTSINMSPKSIIIRNKLQSINYKHVPFHDKTTTNTKQLNFDEEKGEIFSKEKFLTRKETFQNIYTKNSAMSFCGV